jgi:hypothetical protein
MKRRTILLNYPPASSVWHVPAGISMLTAMLRQDGHHVRQRYGHIIGLEHLLRQHGGEAVDEALRTIRDRNSSIERLYAARMTFERVSKGIETDDKFVVERNNVSFVSSYYDGTVDRALDAVKDREKHIWYRYFVEVEVPLAKDLNPDLYAISTADERQFIQGLILASLIKDALPKCLVVIGGNLWSRIDGAFALPRFHEFFDFCDAITYREGYQPIRELAETLDPRSVGGTLWRRGRDEVMINPPAPQPTSFETLPTPVFDGGAQQWSPDQVYSLYTMSNCMMSCGFCAISAGSDSFLGAPRSMSPRRIAEHMSALGTKRFQIFDEMFPIQRQLALGRELKRIGHAAEWECYLTITNSLARPEICEQLYEAGCRAVQLGLETLSPDTLSREDKGWNTPKNYGVILDNLRKAGIQTHVFLLVGIPGEPLHWGLAWAAFLEEYGSGILTIKSGRYRLTRHSPEERGQAHQQWIEVMPDEKPLHLNREFRYRQTSRKKVEAVRDILEEACRRHWAYGVTSTLPWWVNRGRYTWQQLESMARALPSEEPARHLDDAVVRSNTIVKEELKRKARIRSYEDIAGFAHGLL